MIITRKIDGKLYPYDVPTAKDAIAYGLNDDEREIICEIGDLIRKKATEISKRNWYLSDGYVVYTMKREEHPNVRRLLLEQYLTKILEYEFHLHTRKTKKGEVVYDYEIRWN